MIDGVTEMTGSGETSTGRAERNSATSRGWVVPRDNPLLVLRRGRFLVREEGLKGLLWGVFRLLATLWRFVHVERVLRFYHLSIDAAAAVPCRAPSDDVRVHIIESRDDVLALSEQGYEDLFRVVPGMQRRLNGGAVAACAFVGTELASIDWMALSDRARPMVDGTIYPPHIAEGEAYTGGAFTVRRFRGRGIASYRIGVQVQYLRKKGCYVCYSTIAVDNTPSQRCVERYGATYETVFRQRRILGRSSFKTLSTVSSRSGAA